MAWKRGGGRLGSNSSSTANNRESKQCTIRNERSKPGKRLFDCVADAAATAICKPAHNYRSSKKDRQETVSGSFYGVSKVWRRALHNRDLRWQESAMRERPSGGLVSWSRELAITLHTISPILNQAAHDRQATTSETLELRFYRTTSYR